MGIIGLVLLLCIFLAVLGVILIIISAVSFVNTDDEKKDEMKKHFHTDYKGSPFTT